MSISSTTCATAHERFRNASGANGNPQNGDTANVETSGGKELTSVTTGNDTVTIDFVG